MGILITDLTCRLFDLFWKGAHLLLLASYPEGNGTWCFGGWFTEWNDNTRFSLLRLRFQGDRTVLDVQLLDRGRSCGGRNSRWRRLRFYGRWNVCWLGTSQLQTNQISDWISGQDSFCREGFMIFIKERARKGKRREQGLILWPHRCQVPPCIVETLHILCLWRHQRQHWIQPEQVITQFTSCPVTIRAV